MKTLEELLFDYTRGDKTLEETNQALKELGSTLRLDPSRNLFSAQELMETRVGETPDEANGWGILTTVWAAWRKSGSWAAARWMWTWARRRPSSIWRGGATACGATC